MASKIKIHFLGTSAQIPTAGRNHTAILVSYKGENILVDCGEGTQIQFRKAHLNPCSITKILITHRHGDHVFGLPGLLSTMNFSDCKKELHIYGPKGIKKFLDEFLGLNEIKWNFKITVKEVSNSGVFYEGGDFVLASEKMEHGIPTNAYYFKVKDKVRIDKGKIKKCKIPEGPLLGKLKDGKSISYNGKKYNAKDLTYVEKGKKVSIVLDTLYNERIVPFVKNSDILICESSFAGELNDLAKKHLHLTAFQGGQTAKRSKSKELILTHISQRYENRLKDLIDDAKMNFDNVKVAKDFDSFDI